MTTITKLFFFNLALDPTDLKFYYKDAITNNIFSILHYSNRYVNVTKHQWSERE